MSATAMQRSVFLTDCRVLAPDVKDHDTGHKYGDDVYEADGWGNKSDASISKPQETLNISVRWVPVGSFSWGATERIESKATKYGPGWTEPDSPGWKRRVLDISTLRL